ncbi:Ubiquitin-like modifier-activating enzyme ATG7 [Lamellibrachia satsuma]|nr:Ubiquitin-like modifier-activating enzyme ATG7 [Lamellibrachia satsuma]
MAKHLQFAPFSSTLDGGFWHKLSQLKLDVYGLDDEPRNIDGFYSNGDAAGLPCSLTVDFTAFEENGKVPPRCSQMHGVLKNTNTLDDFKACDKKLLLEERSKKLWEDIVSGQAITRPDTLSSFLLLTHADLKKFHYYYWFAFPALCSPESVTVVTEPCPLTARFSNEQIASFLEQYDKTCLPEHTAYFLVTETEHALSVGRLADFDRMSADGSKLLLCFCDPCTLDGYPGWPLRNLLTLTAVHWAEKLHNEVEVICFRDRFKDGNRNVSHSIVMTLHVPSVGNKTECPKCVGWEKNERQKFGPRFVNLSSSMDPARLAESAVDLNLKLMRWRLMPELDLDKLAATKCLLLGAGTLGCNVARSLMAWGIRHMTLVDNGKISYSNPVRQSLFLFEDSLNGGKPKAQTAAEALRRIFPGVNATGVTLSIPMPGHHVSDGILEQTREDVTKLEELIAAHDVVFLLMDTRESRWLPTLIGSATRKIVINAALGFDTFLVVRHGVKMEATGDASIEMTLTSEPKATSSFHRSIQGSELGCYFCNDVVAPGNSTRDRTLDQQCTVARPGMSMLASALAVELLISVLLHPHQGYAAAEANMEDDDQSSGEGSPLGIVPHQIRGFLSRFQYVMPACMAFDKCTACSDIVIEKYRSDGFSFLLKAFNEPSYLEDLTGLTELHAQTIDDEVWELSDDDSMSS